MYRVVIFTICLIFAGLVKAETIPESLLVYLHDKVLLANSLKAKEALSDLNKVFSSEQSDKEKITQAKTKFKKLVREWKKVEAVYIAGELEQDMIDHPRYIDHYHQGNESISKLLEKAIASKKPMSRALFKYSTKGINALEFLLFNVPGSERVMQRQLEGAQIAVENIGGWLDGIIVFYQTDTTFVKGGKSSLNKLVNRLIDSSYKMANWRVGEAGGLVNKYKDSISVSRLEYVKSGLSLDAIIAILETHKQIIENKSGKDLFMLGRLRDVSNEMTFIRDRIDQALDIANSMKQPLSQQIQTEAYRSLFKSLQALHKAYYFMLIESLGLNAQIIDADGD